MAFPLFYASYEDENIHQNNNNNNKRKRKNNYSLCDCATAPLVVILDHCQASFLFPCWTIPEAKLFLPLIILENVYIFTFSKYWHRFNIFCPCWGSSKMTSFSKQKKHYNDLISKWLPALRPLNRGWGQCRLLNDWCFMTPIINSNVVEITEKVSSGGEAAAVKQRRWSCGGEAALCFETVWGEKVKSNFNSDHKRESGGSS